MATAYKYSTLPNEKFNDLGYYGPSPYGGGGFPCEERCDPPNNNPWTICGFLYKVLGYTVVGVGIFLFVTYFWAQIQCYLPDLEESICGGDKDLQESLRECYKSCQIYVGETQTPASSSLSTEYFVNINAQLLFNNTASNPMPNAVPGSQRSGQSALCYPTITTNCDVSKLTPGTFCIPIFIGTGLLFTAGNPATYSTGGILGRTVPSCTAFQPSGYPYGNYVLYNGNWLQLGSRIVNPTTGTCIDAGNYACFNIVDTVPLPAGSDVDEDGGCASQTCSS